GKARGPERSILQPAGGLSASAPPVAPEQGAPSIAPRVRAAGGFALGLIAALSLLFVAEKAFPRSKAGTAQLAPKTAAGPAVTATLAVYAGSGEAGYVNGPAASAQFS